MSFSDVARVMVGAVTGGLNTRGLEEFGLLFRGMLTLVQHSINGVQISTGAGRDNVCTCAFTGDKATATEIALQDDFAQRVFASRHRGDMVFHQIPALVQNSVDRFHRSVDSAVTEG